MREFERMKDSATNYMIHIMNMKKEDSILVITDNYTNDIGEAFHDKLTLNMDILMMKYLNELEDEYRRLKKMYAEKKIISEFHEKYWRESFKAILPSRDVQYCERVIWKSASKLSV